MKAITVQLWILCAIMGISKAERVPKLPMFVYEMAIRDQSTSEVARKILKSIVNDYMTLMYSIETPYTTGEQVLPTGISIEEMDEAASDLNLNNNIRAVFKKFSDTYKSGDLTPQSEPVSSDSKIRPVLVVVDMNILSIIGGSFITELVRRLSKH